MLLNNLVVHSFRTSIDRSLCCDKLRKNLVFPDISRKEVQTFKPLYIRFCDTHINLYKFYLKHCSLRLIFHWYEQNSHASLKYKYLQPYSNLSFWEEFARIHVLSHAVFLYVKADVRLLLWHVVMATVTGMDQPSWNMGGVLDPCVLICSANT